VIGEGATGRVRADRAWLSNEYGPRGWLHEQIDVLTYGLVNTFTEAGPPISLREAVGKIAPRPVLLIVAGKVADERTAAEYIREGSPRTVAIWDVPRAGHTGGLATQPAEWEAHVIAFLDHALLPGG
jgi:hypothetical protein